MLSAEKVGRYFVVFSLTVPRLWNLPDSTSEFRCMKEDSPSSTASEITESEIYHCKIGMNGMSDECLCKECPICGNRITGANYYCPTCKLCLCFHCGTKIVLAEHEVKPTCPSCGNKMT